jgi:hypothetical protein
MLSSDVVLLPLSPVLLLSCNADCAALRAKAEAAGAVGIVITGAYA